MKCTVCQILLEDDFKQHYASEYHIYNLKRKNNGLLPTSTIPKEEVIEEELYTCGNCSKQFIKLGRFNQHVNDCNRNKQVPAQDGAETDEQNVIYYSDDFDDEPYLYLPSGTVLGNKKYLRIFKQNDKSEYKERGTVVVYDKNVVVVPEQSKRNEIKISLGMNRISRFKMQFSH